MSEHPDPRRWLRRWLPRGAARLGVSGELPQWATQALPADAIVVPSGDEASAADGLDAVVAALEAPRPALGRSEADVPAALDARLGALAEPLAPGGRLLLLVLGAPGGGDLDPEVERALLEAGFAVRPGSIADLGETVGALAADHDGYTMTRHRSGDEDEILELFRRSFHVERSRDHWAWKYRSNPDGNGHISVARDPAGRLVGQYCAYPVRLHRGGRLSLVHQVGDTMTAPEVRAVGRGPTSVLARVARHFYAVYCHRRVDFNYGFNTGNIQKFSMRFVGATKVEEVPYRERDLRSAPPRPPRRLIGGDRLVERPDAAALDDLWRRSRDDLGTLVVRDSRYLTWRYLQRPDQAYLTLAVARRGRLVAWGAFSRREDRLVWGDLLVERRHVASLETLLAAAVERLSSGSAMGSAMGPAMGSVVGWFPPRPGWLARHLEAVGFEPAPEPQGLGLMVVPFAEPSAPSWCREELFYTYGDSDLF